MFFAVDLELNVVESIRQLELECGGQRDFRIISLEIAQVGCIECWTAVGTR